MNNYPGPWFRYHFIFPDHTEKKVLLQLDPGTLHLKVTPKNNPPEWTKLDFFKCPNCRLNPSQHHCCPLALNLVDLIELFKDEISINQVDIRIETEERVYQKQTSLQNGLSSLIGIYMVTAGCPVMEKIKPMVRFHLPFATEFETKYRAITMYLFAQFFQMKQGQTMNWELTGLTRIYDEIRIVNEAFCRRLQNIQILDASLNAVFILDCFACGVILTINREMLAEFERYFNAYLE
ncbi:MAG TPA: hypothetical protein VHY08_29725 [Bacillota bacterium]|nr:hypothetical protein [Bacillota bacterium]